ncbi:MAG: hypothetical protein LUO93_05720, partial [Methanomicrobiales archaeon]|nr:hypothetical protein [Methanomicrobiales archaeon]
TYIVIGAAIAFGGCIAFLAAIIPQLLCSTVPSFFSYAFAVALAIGAGQGIFKLMPELKDVAEVKAAR